MLPIIVVVSFEEGRGGGHLVRGAELTQKLRALGREAFLFIAGGRGVNEAHEIARGVGVAGIDTEGFDSLLFFGSLEEKRWAFVVLDRFATSYDELRRYMALCPIAAIDEGGIHRRDCDFLFDLLPQLPRHKANYKANICAPHLLSLPKNKKNKPFPPVCFEDSKNPAKILITFGAENAKNLSLKTAMALSSIKNAEITVITAEKPIKAVLKSALNMNFIEFIPNLREKLAEFDIIITHFGLCAFEALAAGTPVMLISPSRYHEKLARNCGFFSRGLGLSGIPNKSQWRFCEEASRKTAKRYNLLERSPAQKDISGFIAALEPMVFRKCPVCGANDGAKNDADCGVLARFNDRTYRRCSRCGTIFASRLAPPPVVYSDVYFFEDYKRQYGKSYLDDFAHIKALGKKRLFYICRLVRGSANGGIVGGANGGVAGKKLLDIGCAYGPFLDAARDAGFEALGLDASLGAVNYVQKTLGIPARQGFFPDAFDEPFNAPKNFDVITLWFVIEHFTEPRAALRRIHRLLAKDGILAFSTPSASGVSGLFSRLNFLEQSPADHWTIWNPHGMFGAGGVRRALRDAGFKTIKIVSTGHHGERVPFIGSIFKSAAGKKIWNVISAVFMLGDTFEVYARKSETADG